ncbi:MAG: ATPase [Rhizobiaceae bacterium]|nr:ATPase [Rhizobiaceae bacterium]MCV0406244.1 ATPase [Rhizobiaceae bacterium]
MRDLLSDLEAGRHLSDPDPVRRAQLQMKTPLPKRFYQSAQVVQDEAGGWSVQLDGKPVRTPGKSLLALPTDAAARLVAAEFEAQRELIDPPSMPVLRLANTAIDGVAGHIEDVVEDVMRYSGSDLLCYRADGPDDLVARQAQAWDPWIDWVRTTIGARFWLAEGVMHVEQPRESIGAIGIHLRQRSDPFRLAAIHVMTSLTGSAILSLAVESGALSVDDAWSAAHVDEDWNIEQWGEDAEATARRAARFRDMKAAAELICALDSTG